MNYQLSWEEMKEYDLLEMEVSEDEMFESVYHKDLTKVLNRIMNDKYIFNSKLEKDVFIDYYAKGNSIRSISSSFRISKVQVKLILDSKLSMIQAKYKEELLKLYNI